MFFSWLLLALCAITPIVALRTPTVSPHWVRGERAPATQPLDFTVALRQAVTSTQLFDQLLLVSTPSLPATYGKHWSYEQINDYVRPSLESRTAIATWLSSHQLEFEWSEAQDWVTFTATVAQAEKLLNTTYFTFTHATQNNAKPLIRCTEYTLPASVRSHVEVIGPTSRFPLVSSATVKMLSPKSKAVENRHLKSEAADPCSDSQVTPDCLRRIYSVGNTSASIASTVAVTGFLEQYISLNDLTKFFSSYDPSQSSRAPPAIYGPNVAGSPGVEASLDIQYVSAMAHAANTSFWYTAGRMGPSGPAAQNEPFLQFAQLLSNTSVVPFVISTSYGDDENTVDTAYALRLDAEFAKLGLRGVSLLFSSGDSGVGGRGGKSCTRFMPTLPSTLQSVTSVGATGFAALPSLTERAASFSSGGFSDDFARPAYQDSFVLNYFQVAKSLPDQKYWNRTGRAFPDISALGEDYPIVVSGATFGVSGTSCSSPAMAGLVATLNSIRLAAGKPTLGYLNPLIYEIPAEAFIDTTLGSNPGCGTPGFQTAVGYDPATGRGTPQFDVWVKLVSSLP